MHLLKHVMDLQCRFKLVWKLLKEKHRSIRHPEGSLDFTCISTCAVKTKVFASRRLRLIEVSKYWVGYKLDRCETRGEICGKRDLQEMIDGKYKSPCTQRAPPPPPPPPPPNIRRWKMESAKLWLQQIEHLHPGELWVSGDTFLMQSQLWHTSEHFKQKQSIDLC